MPMTNISLGFEKGGYTYGLCKCCKNREKQTKESGSGLCLISLSVGGQMQGQARPMQAHRREAQAIGHGK